MADERSIREKLMTYGHNGGALMTDQEWAELLAHEVAALKIPARSTFDLLFYGAIADTTVVPVTPTDATR